MARIQTSAGDILIELDEKRAPVSVANFRDYADSGFYDGTIFHRVIEGFMIQGGGYNQNYMRKQTRRPIPNEATNGLSNTQYTISMARTNAPHSATSQFFINSADNSNLDHRARDARGWGYAVFGRVVDGYDVVDYISEVDTGAAGPFRRDVPRDQVIILSVQVSPANTDAAVKNAEIAGDVSNSLIGSQAGSSGGNPSPQTQQRQAKLN
ncbi:MAG: peptidylprolyl isomerase [Gammaproteobacteria bacterium]|nr:peptidylprolyl isomerase [Gammaproteobacteria bacterium]